MRGLYLVLALAFLLVFAAASDTLHLTPVQQLSFKYQYNLLGWEAVRFPSKWLYWLGDSMFPYRQTWDQRVKAVQEYFKLKQESAALQGEMERAAATGSGDVQAMEQRLQQLNRRLGNLRPQVEETLEATVSTVLRREGVPWSVGSFVFPPVDISLDSLPTLLVMSTRDRIQRRDDVLLTPDISIPQQEDLEDGIRRQRDLSALVTGLGGISTYPAIIFSDDLRGALAIASHEWLHNYLFFRALGQHYWSNGDMGSLNETTADLFGGELGDMVYTYLTEEKLPVRIPGAPPEPCPEDQFCFDREMRNTRIGADELLSDGKIDQAEAYMEERRLVFVEKGYYIRKLNQAYFAFHGTYADSPASVSPIHDQLLKVRRASPSLGAFVHLMAGISSYEEFESMVQKLPDRGRQAVG